MPFGLRAPDWAKEGRDWPYRARSRFIRRPNVHWHVQDIGVGPTVLAIHGTGAATHSWAPLVNVMGDQARFVLMDLPGHGFSSVSSFYRASLDRVVDDLADLVQVLDIKPALILGHSAGAAVAVELAHLIGCRTMPVIAVNGAFKPFSGFAKSLAPLMARALHLNPLSALTIAGVASDVKRVRRLTEQIGSPLNEEQLQRYHALLSCSGHIGGALGMMAHWNLDLIQETIRTHQGPLHLLVGGRDKAVLPQEATELAASIPGIRVHHFAGYGHLLHEEAPAAGAEVISEVMGWPKGAEASGKAT